MKRLYFFSSILIFACTQVGKQRIESANSLNSRLILANAKLKVIPDKVFTLKNLKILDLFNNDLDSIDARIGDLVNLEELYLGKNRLVDLPEAIRNCINLKILSLQFNEFEAIPEVVFQLKNLEQLWLFSNNIEIISMNIKELKKLRNLKLGFNSLKTIPISLFDCIELRHLSLNRNFIDSLPEEISQLEYLNELELTNAGNLLQLPETMCSMRKLEDLYISSEIVVPNCLLMLRTGRLKITIR